MSNPDENGCWQMFDNNPFTMILLIYLLVNFVIINYNDPYDLVYINNSSTVLSISKPFL